MVARNVCEAGRLAAVVHKRGATWTPAEARRFLAAAESDGYHPLWLLALTTGAGQGELLGIRWQDLDMGKGTMAVRQCVTVCNRKAIVQAPNSRAAVRTITLPPEAVAALNAHRKRQVAGRLAAGPLWTDYDLVFATQTGGPNHPSNAVRNFAKIIARAGVPRIRFHDLRHTHAMWLIAGGEPIPNVSERLGHAKTSITVDTYANVAAATRDRAAAVVGSMLVGPVTGDEAIAAD